MSVCGVSGCMVEVDSGRPCDGCWNGRGTILAAIPELWLRLHNLLPARGAQGFQADGGVRSPFGSRPPLAVHVLDQIRKTPLVLADWVNLIISPDRLALEGRRWGEVLSRAVHILQATDEALGRTSTAGAYLTNLHRIRSSLLFLNGLDPAVSTLPGWCIECGGQPVFRDRVRERIVCTRCRKVWTEHGYTTSVLRLAGHGDDSATNSC